MSDQVVRLEERVRRDVDAQVRNCFLIQGSTIW